MFNVKPWNRIAKAIYGFTFSQPYGFRSTVRRLFEPNRSQGIAKTL